METTVKDISDKNAIKNVEAALKACVQSHDGAKEILATPPSSINPLHDLPLRTHEDTKTKSTVKKSPHIVEQATMIPKPTFLNTSQKVVTPRSAKRVARPAVDPPSYLPSHPNQLLEPRRSYSNISNATLKPENVELTTTSGDFKTKSSIDEIDKKLQQYVTNTIISTYNKSKVQCNETGSIDFEIISKIFEEELKNHCETLHNWLKDAGAFNLNNKEQPAVGKFLQLSQELKHLKKVHDSIIKDQNEQMQAVIKENEMREANLIYETDAKLNKMEIQMGELEKKSRNFQETYQVHAQELITENETLRKELEIKHKKFNEMMKAKLTKVNAHEQTIKELKKQTIQLSETAKKIELKVTSATKELQESQKTNKHLLNKLTQSEAREKHLQNLNAEKEAKLSKQTELIDEQTASLQDKLNKSQERLRDIETVNIEINEKLKTKEKAENETIARLLSELNENKETVKDLEISNQELSKINETHLQSLLKLTDDLRETQAERDALKATQQAWDTSIKEENEKLSNTIIENQKRIDQLKCCNTELAMKIRVQSETIESLTKELEEHCKRIVGLQTLNTELMDEYKSQNHYQNELIERLQTEREDIQKRMFDLQASNIELEESSKNRNKKQTDTIDLLQYDLNEAQDRIRTLESQKIELETELQKQHGLQVKANENLQNMLNESQERNALLERLYTELELQSKRQNESQNQQVQSLKAELSNNVERLKNLEIIKTELTADLRKQSQTYDEIIERMKNELNEYKSRNMHLKNVKSKLAACLKEQTEFQTKRIDQLEKTLNESQRRVGILEHLNAGLAENSKVQGEIQSKAVQQLLHGVREGIKCVKHLSAMNTDLVEQSEFQSETIKRLQNEICDSKKFVKNMEVDHVKSQISLNEEIDKNKKRVNDYEKLIADLTAKLARRTEIDSQTKEQLVNELYESRQRIKQLESLNEQLKEQLRSSDHVAPKDLNVEFHDLRNGQLELKNSANLQMEKICECNKLVVALREENARKNELNELKSKYIQNLRDEIKDLVKDLDITRDLVEHKNKQIKKLQLQLDTKAEYFETLFNTFKHKQAEYNDMEENCKLKDDTILRSSKIISSQNNAIQMMESKIFHLTTTIQTFQIHVSLSGQQGNAESEGSEKAITYFASKTRHDIQTDMMH